MRMVWTAELRWLIAGWMLLQILRLIEKEASTELILVFKELGDKFQNDPKFNTVAMRKRRQT